MSASENIGLVPLSKVCKQKIFLQLDWLRSNTKLMSPKKTRDKRWKNPWSLGFPMKTWSYWSISIILCNNNCSIFIQQHYNSYDLFIFHMFSAAYVLLVTNFQKFPFTTMNNLRISEKILDWKFRVNLTILMLVLWIKTINC